MSVGFELDIQQREELGKRQNRRLRKTGRVPAVVYGGGQPPSSVTLDHARLLHHMEREAFYTSILTLKLGKETQAVVVKDVHRHPVRRQVLHLDFQRILEDQEITLDVPIHFLGEDVAVGVRQQGGEVIRLTTDVEVTCLPKNLPEFLELDVSQLELNELLHLSDIVVPEGVELVALSHGQDPAVISIVPPRKEEEEVVEVEEGLELPEAEAEAEGEEPTAEGEKPGEESSD